MPEHFDKQIEDFLTLFDNNLEAAQHALDAYVGGQASKDDAIEQPVNTGVGHNEMIISLENVSKIYKLGKQPVNALRNVNFSIYAGEFIAITGSSGSGKSTLLQIIGCLDKPTSGKVYVEGKDITELNDSALSELRKKTIGFIFQSFYLQPFLRLEDNIAVPSMFTGTKAQTIDNKVISLLEQVDLTERAKHYPKELSGGQIQRAAIARALVNSPSIILADEPTGNLDSFNSQSIIDLFKKVRNDFGTTIVVVTHDPLIAKQADRVITLRDGVVV
jgi:ABC-type lipoprotein export system ATPase subunit